MRSAGSGDDFRREAPSAPSGQLPPSEGAFFVGCPQGKQPTERLLPPAGEEAGRRSLTDGGGDCRAMGTVVFCPRHRPTRNGIRPCSKHPQSALRAAPSFGRSLFRWLPLPLNSNKHPEAFRMLVVFLLSNSPCTRETGAAAGCRGIMPLPGRGAEPRIPRILSSISRRSGSAGFPCRRSASPCLRR